MKTTSKFLSATALLVVASFPQVSAEVSWSVGFHGIVLALLLLFRRERIHSVHVWGFSKIFSHCRNKTSSSMLWHNHLPMLFFKLDWPQEVLFLRLCWVG